MSTPTGPSQATARLHADAVRLLSSYADLDPGQRSVREAMLAFLAARPDATERGCVPGHLTASALVVDPGREAVLLTLHPRVGSWLQLGGHCEDDASIAAAALREATEESGIEGLALDPDPIHLAVHPITCSLGLPTRHLDVRFLAVAPAGAVATVSPESLDLEWFGRAALPLPIGDDIAELTRRGFARLADEV